MTERPGPSGGPSASARARAIVAVWLVCLLVGVGLAPGLAWGDVASAMTDRAGPDDSLVVLRRAVERAGPFGPVIYVSAVVVEVVVAPLPGVLLYAPGGAIFGGAVGGTLSLAGNVIGAMLAAAVARAFGHGVTGWLERSALSRNAARLRARGIWVIALLRVNPLTSSDLVSYASGLAGVASWRVGVGTLIGMAPLCYAQAYAVEWLFGWMPAAGPVLVLSAALYGALVVWMLVGGRAGGVHSSSRSDPEGPSC